jgi:integrase
VSRELHIQLRRDTGYYRYIRRIPASIEPYLSQKVVRRSLETKDREAAIALAAEIDAELEEVWAGVEQVATGRDEWERQAGYERIAQAMGFDPMTADELLAEPDTDELMARLLALNGQEENKIIVEALLGRGDEPQKMLSGIFHVYMHYKASELAGYSTSQLRRHVQAKERALQYLLQAVGDKPLEKVTRRDALRFRTWWEKKLVADELSADSANRSFADIQGMLSVIDGALLTNYRALWGGLRIKASRRKPKKRASFTPDFVQKRILAPGVLDFVRFDVRMAFYAQIETGARPSEIVNLRPESIKAWDKIPHIVIEETDERILKTGNATRTIPLVGVSLWAMRQCPEGFPALRNNEDSYSAAIGKAFTKLAWRLTPEHTPYSIRHTFQDRILASNAPDRVQTDLMGHEFSRVKYGEGAALKQKQALLEKIKFDWEEPVAKVA